MLVLKRIIRSARPDYPFLKARPLINIDQRSRYVVCTNRTFHAVGTWTFVAYTNVQVYDSVNISNVSSETDNQVRTT